MIYNQERIYGGDELLGPSVTDEVIEKAESWLYHLANRLGVAKEDVKGSFIVQELVSAYCYREVCLMKSFALGVGYHGGYSQQQQADFYSQKLAFYESRIKQMEKRITAADLVGSDGGQQSSYAGYRSVAIKRG